MTRFFAGVLSVIAVGLMLIAYGLLRPGPAAYGPDAAVPAAYPAGYIQGAQQGAYYPTGAYPAAHATIGAPGVVYLAPGQVLAPGMQPVAAVAPMTTMPQAVPVMAVPTAAAPQVVEVRPAGPARQVVRSPSRSDRNWTKTALIIGGTTAAGAGIGGIFGGKKGALIGAAIGGGASSIHQATR